MSGSLSRDGLGGMRSNLRFGGFKGTDLAQGSDPTDAVRMDQIVPKSDGGIFFGQIEAPGFKVYNQVFRMYVNGDGNPILDFVANAYQIYNITLNQTGWVIGGTLQGYVAPDGAFHPRDTQAQAQANGVTSGQSANGYWRRMPDGAGGFILEQWGSVTLPASGGSVSAASVTFPVEFTNAASISFCATAEQGPNPSWNSMAFTTGLPVTTGLLLTADTGSPPTQVFTQTVNVRWMARGK